jgi:hypothetical protein
VTACPLQVAAVRGRVEAAVGAADHPRQLPGPEVVLDLSNSFPGRPG